MARIGWLVVVLTISGGLAGRVLPAEPPVGRRATSEMDWLQTDGERIGQEARVAPLGSKMAWRRTCDGWERSDHWPSSRIRGAGPPALGPIVVGLLEALLACTALVACSGGMKRRRGRRGEDGDRTE